MTDKTRILIADATALVHADIAAEVVPAAVSASVAAEGQGGYGFSRVADCDARARSGKLNLNAKIITTLRRPASVFIDADHRFAFPALDAGMPIAQKMGMAIMAFGNRYDANSDFLTRVSSLLGMIQRWRARVCPAPSRVRLFALLKLTGCWFRRII